MRLGTPISQGMPPVAWFALQLQVLSGIFYGETRHHAKGRDPVSIRLMTAVWGMATETPAEKLILLALADRADDEGNNVYPAKSTVAKQCCLDIRTVRRIMAKFNELGILAVVSMRVGAPAVYRLDIEKLAEWGRTIKSAPEADTGAGDPTEDAEPKTPAKPKTEPAQGEPAPSLFDPGHDVLPPGHDVLPPRASGPTPPGVRPANPSIQPPIQPPTNQKGAKSKKDQPPVDPLAFAKDWPVLHVKDGDHVVPEPYASCHELRTALVEWIRQRVAKGKGMPTVFGMERTNCGWWTRYDLEAVVHAVEKAAAESWQGLIEDVAKRYEPNTCRTASGINSVTAKAMASVEAMRARAAQLTEDGQAPALEHHK